MASTTPPPDPANQFASFGFNEQACYDLFLQSPIFKENLLVPSIKVGQGPGAKLPVYCWDRVSRLWCEANDATTAVLYYDWVREVIRDVVRKAAAKNKVGDSPSLRLATLPGVVYRINL